MAYIYVSQASRGGSDANDGADPSTPKLTLAAANALVVGDGDVLFADRKSTFTGQSIDAVASVHYDGWSWDYDSGAEPTLLDATTETRVSGDKAIINRNSTGAGTYCIQCDNVRDVVVAGFDLRQGENVFIRSGDCSRIVLCNVIGSEAGISTFIVYDAIDSDGDCTFYGCTSVGNANGDGFSNRHGTLDVAIGCLASGHTGSSPAGDGWTSHDASGWTLTRCTATGNTDGADLTGSGAHVITDCDFSSNSGDGVKTSASPLTITGTQMDSNGGWGLRLDGAGACVADRCTTNSNGSDGVVMTSTANFTATNHTSNGNTEAGFNIGGTTTTRTLTRCSANANGTHGVYVTVPGTYTIDGMEAIDNVGSGVWFFPNASSSELNLFNAVMVGPTAVVATTGILHVPTQTATILVNVYNCTFNNRNESGSNNYYSIFFGTTVTTTLDMQSCVFTTHQTNNRAYHIIMNGTVAVQAVAIDRNVYNTVTSSTSRWRDGPVTTYNFANWKLVAGSPDANSLNSNPLFSAIAAVTEADYYRIPLLTSPAKTVGGTNLFSAGVAQDFRGRDRASTGAWQAGAFLIAATAGNKLGSLWMLLLTED